MQKFSNAKKFNKTNIKKISQNKPVVYRLQNSSGKELYDGIAKRGRAQERLLEHLTIKREKIPKATRIKIAQVPNLEKAKRVEQQAIKKFHPKFNIKGK